MLPQAGVPLYQKLPIALNEAQDQEIVDLVVEFFTSISTYQDIKLRTLIEDVNRALPSTNEFKVDNC